MAKHVVVADFGVGKGKGLHVNPTRDGGTRWEVPYGKLLKAAKDSGIEVYVQRIEAGQTLRMKAGNKVLGEFLRSYKPAKQESVKVEKPASTQATTPRRRTRKPAQDFELQLANEQVQARKTGDWSAVEALVNSKHQIA